MVHNTINYKMSNSEVNEVFLMFNLFIIKLYNYDDYCFRLIIFHKLKWYIIEVTKVKFLEIPP